MCLGGRRQPPQIETQESESEFENRPVTVTGKQTGVDNPKDTKKATEKLKIKRQKEEGIYEDPDLKTTEKLTSKTKSRKKNLTKQQQAGRKAAKTKAQKLAKARINRRSRVGGRV